MNKTMLITLRSLLLPENKNLYTGRLEISCGTFTQTMHLGLEKYTCHRFSFYRLTDIAYQHRRLIFPTVMTPLQETMQERLVPRDYKFRLAIGEEGLDELVRQFPGEADAIYGHDRKILPYYALDRRMRIRLVEENQSCHTQKPYLRLA